MTPVDGYGFCHSKVARVRGTARQHTCPSCGKPAAEWAFNHRICTEPTRDKIGTFCGEFNPDHYLPLCKKCHSWFDSWRVGEFADQVARYAVQEQEVAKRVAAWTEASKDLEPTDLKREALYLRDSMAKRLTTTQKRIEMAKKSWRQEVEKHI